MKKRKENPAKIFTGKQKNSKKKSRLVITPRLISDIIKVKYNRKVQQITLNKLFFTVGLCISISMMIMSFEWKFHDDRDLISRKDFHSDFEDIINIPVTEQAPPPPPKIVQPRIIEVPNEKEIIEDVKVDLDIQMTEDMIIDEYIDQQMETDLEEEIAEEVFTIVEQKPEPNGGFNVFYEFVRRNMKYPPMACRSGIEGRVFIEFIVDKDGSLTDLKVIKGIGGGCDEEALRIFGIAPKWNPGKQRGQPVKVKMVLPILFRLE